MTGVAETAKPKQRTRVDWGLAKAFYVGLSPTERSYARVGREFRVSSVTVRKHAHRDGWVEAAEKADGDAAAKALTGALKSRDERNAQFLRIVDLANQSALDKLTKNELDVRLADLPALGKHAELILGEATDRVSFAELQEALGVVISLAVAELPKKAREAFLEKVRTRLGAIGGDE